LTLKTELLYCHSIKRFNNDNDKEEAIHE
jgi:hypothetical protein